jgi:hypothetical protein
MSALIVEEERLVGVDPPPSSTLPAMRAISRGASRPAARALRRRKGRRTRFEQEASTRILGWLPPSCDIL